MDDLTKIFRTCPFCHVRHSFDSAPAECLEKLYALDDDSWRRGRFLEYGQKVDPAFEQADDARCINEEAPDEFIGWQGSD
jgi:hypothetical protein